MKHKVFAWLLLSDRLNTRDLREGTGMSLMMSIVCFVQVEIMKIAFTCSLSVISAGEFGTIYRLSG
jgi:hypothetical protein